MIRIEYINAFPSKAKAKRESLKAKSDSKPIKTAEPNKKGRFLRMEASKK